MGRNTANYTLDKYFSGYENDSTDSRKQRLKDKLGQFKNNIDDENQDFTYFFAGIKVYPPLNFNPWPSEIDEELEKVNYLYEWCEQKRIPIMTHCSGGGFSALSKQDARDYTNPTKGWSEVLSNYPNLKICFAHFGSLMDDNNMPSDEWQREIIELSYQYECVYTDISCNEGGDYYKDLNADINKEGQAHLADKILFGTDSSINLFANKEKKSYYGKLKRFIDNRHLDEMKKHQLCTYNLEKFLFDTCINESSEEIQVEAAD